MKRIILIYLLFLMLIPLNGQTSTENLIGKVSFVSSQNVYVKFKSTAGISTGDTLYITEGNKVIPSLIVNSLSSTSCLCTQISGDVLPVDHIIMARIRIENNKNEAGDKAADIIMPAVSDTKNDTSLAEQKQQPGRKQSIRGSISVISYSDFSDSPGEASQRFRYTLSFNARNIANSKISFETYISFRHKTGEWQSVSDDIFSALKIYNLSARYDISSGTNLSIGRKINPRISSIGAMDGIQFEKSIKGFSFGLVAGSRPDYTNYGFNFSLFQYGAYLSLNTKGSGKYTESTLAFMEQTNNFITDRRFLYFQHSNNLISNLRFFTTVEVDLFKLENDIPVNTLDLTGMYLSLTYRVSRGLSLTGSYDARKNMVYYETYKTLTERIIEEEMRQGYRLGGNLRIAKNMTLGLQTGYRFLKTDPHPSANVSGYYTWSEIPGIRMSATLSGTWLQSNYIDAWVAGLNLRKDLPGGKFQVGAGYHFSDNTLPENSLSFIQHSGEMNIYWQLAEKLSLSANYEGVFESGFLFNRIYLQARLRF